MSGTGLCAYVAARIFDGDDWHENAALLVEHGSVTTIVSSRGLPPDAQRIDLGGGMLAPGLVDLQVNGGGGVFFAEQRSAAAIRHICMTHIGLGTTALLPTLVSSPRAHQAEAITAAREAYGAMTLGFADLHLEGPHLSLARRGAHDPSCLRVMDDADADALIAARSDLPALLVTLAPEMVADTHIARLARAGISVSLGHSEASAGKAQAAINAGATLVTHLFNAMGPIAGRDPGLAGAALLSGVWAGLIADGIHLDPAAIALALRAKAEPGRIFLVSDAMPTVGSALDHFLFSGRTVTRKDGSLRFADGTLAGADIALLDAVRWMHGNTGVQLGEALRMDSRYPALAIGRTDIGVLSPGARADFIHLDDDLSLHGVWVGGVRFSA